MREREREGSVGERDREREREREREKETERAREREREGERIGLSFEVYNKTCMIEYMIIEELIYRIFIVNASINVGEQNACLMSVSVCFLLNLYICITVKRLERVFHGIVLPIRFC